MMPTLINPKHYIQEFKQLIKFITRPYQDFPGELTVNHKVTGTWTMFVVKMVLAVIVGVLIGLFYDPENKTTISMTERFSPPMLLLVAVFILPLLEEIAFRLSLKFKPHWLAFSLAVLAYYITSKAIYHTKLSDTQHQFELRIGISLIVMVTTYLLASLPVVKKRLERVWMVNFRWVLYLLCLGFAWIHIFNYELTWQHLLLMPIITLPKLTSALCYSYVRIQYGFIYCYAIHVVNNGIGFAVNVLSGSN